MAAVRQLLSVGTTKLGKSIFGWAIPAITTCPGRSEVCSRVCYATHGRFATRKVRALQLWRYRQSTLPTFADAMCDEIFRRGVLVLRVGVSGDFFSPKYTRAWVEIARRSPNTRFFAYTRSWRVPQIEPHLRAFAALENVRLWYSADAATGFPPDVPDNVRVAWLQHDLVAPDANADLVFQVRAVRAQPWMVALPVVCEQETQEGSARGVNCANCGRCWK